MAQFDVYSNPSANTRRVYPYLLDVQSPIISSLNTRIVIPLGFAADFGGGNLERLTPAVEYGGQMLVILTPQVASVSTNLLKNPVGSLSHHRDAITSALDFAISGF